MTITRFIVSAAVLAGLTVVVPAAEDSREPSADGERRGGMPVVAERHYRMLAKIRPLLFWVSRDDVGGARILWLGDRAGGRGFELLIGSDPDRAPRRINRWGYIAEEVSGSRASTLGLMKQSNEKSVEDAKASVATAGAGTHAFKAIRATSVNGRAISNVLTLHARDELTYRDVGSLLELVDETAPSAASKTVELPRGTRPGFLIALADLMADPSLKSVPYVYNGRFHTLRAKDVDPVSMRVGGRDYTRLVRARFETENQATRERTPFEITYGTSGDLERVPVHVVYQPRWWFQVELFLEEAGGF